MVSTWARRLSYVQVVVIAAALGAGIWFRTAGLGTESVWHDEAHSGLMARLAPAEIVRASATADNNPPLTTTFAMSDRHAYRQLVVERFDAITSPAASR